MKVTLVVVGRPGALVADGVAEFEKRAGRYWNLEVIEVKEHAARRGLSEELIREAESKKLLARVPAASVTVALTRDGKAWSSDELASFLENLMVQGKAGVAFLIGGALGLSQELIGKADRTLSISPMTLTHELARLVFTEQLYRAGTILRGEPYHKARA